MVPWAGASCPPGTISACGAGRTGPSAGALPHGVRAVKAKALLLISGVAPRMTASLIIAVDGPAASGKGTIARALAAHFGLPHMDTGLLYRTVALRLWRWGGDPGN